MILKSLSKNVLMDDKPAEGGGGAAPANTPAAPAKTDVQKIDEAFNKATAAEAAKSPATPKIVKPLMAHKPPEGLLEKEMNLDDAPSDLLEDGAPTSTKKDDKQQVAKTVVEDKKVQATEKKDDKQQVKIADAGTRDYSGYTVEEQAVLKQMSKPAFEFTTKKLKELKELKEQKPESYLQHPEAFTLSPEYREVSSKVQLADFEATHWKQQLLNIRNGKPWRGLQGIDDKGQPVYSGPFKATDESEIEVNNALQFVIGETQNLRGKLGEMQTGFKSRIDNDTNLIKAEMTKRFEWVAKPELLKEKLSIPEVGDVSIEDIRKQFTDLFPRYYHNSPPLETASNMFVALQIYGSRIRELEAELGKEKKLKGDIKTAEPNIEGGNNGSATVSEKDIVFDDKDMP